MGCGKSKIDSEAVKLCRERTKRVKDARDSWYSFAAMHLAYFESLIAIQDRLKNFIGEAIVMKKKENDEGVAADAAYLASSGNEDSSYGTGNFIENWTNILPHQFMQSDTQTLLQSNNMRSSEPSFGDQMENWGFFQHLSEAPDRYEMELFPDNIWNSHGAAPWMNPPCFVDSFSNFYNHHGLSKTSFDGNEMGYEEVRASEGSPNLEGEAGDLVVSDLQKALHEINNTFSDIIVHGNDVSKMFGTTQPSVALTTGSSFSNKFSQILCRAEAVFARRTLLRSAYRILKFVDSGSQNHHNETNTITSGLSLTLDKICAWENKLCKEVEVAEKLRLDIVKERIKLRKLHDTSAKSFKIDASRLSLEKLTPKMTVAIAIVERVSKSMHRIRDEELHPQIREFIQRLQKMWKKLSEAHQKQLDTITNAISSIEIMCSSSDSSYKAVELLEAETTNLEKAFFNWARSHRAFPDLLNNWLKKFLPLDKMSNLSSASSPPVLAICNRWSDAVWKISEARVLQALHNFSLLLRLLRLKLQQESHQRHKMEYLSNYHENEVKKFFVESGISWEECSPLTGEADENLFSAGISDSRYLSLRTRYLNLKPIRAKLKEAHSSHGKVMEELKTYLPNLLQKGLLPVFEALKNLSLEMCNALEQVL